MTFPSGQDDLSAVCPHLGLADDADSHATYATDAHRCYRLENPTRIATPHQEKHCLGANHTTCPVYRGEGIAAATEQQRPAGAPPGRPAPPAAVAGSRSPFETRGRPGRPTPDRPLRPGGPRPRPGGISMPVATIGLFVLAVVVIALAFWIQSVVGGDDDDNTPAGGTATSTITGTPTSGTPGGTGTTAGGGTTPTGTAGNGTPTGTATTPAGGDADTYTIQSGDNCGTIADQFGISIAQLQEANPDINEGCTNLIAGETLNIP